MGFGLFGGLLSLVLLVLFLYVLYRILRPKRPTPDALSDKMDSLEILRNRLARGDISPEEYQRMRELLVR
jgi:putative membrane protein